jgi:hypothetical protein
VIVTAAALPVHAVQERTSKIPSVFAALGDAVGLGVVSNLTHPGGNLTGLLILDIEISSKRLRPVRARIRNAPSSYPTCWFAFTDPAACGG